MTKGDFYKLTDILDSEVLGNFMHGGEAAEVIAMFEEKVEKSCLIKNEESASKDRIGFKSLFRIYDMIEPTEKAKFHLTRLIRELEEEGYINDADIAKTRLKVWNGEKVGLATMDEEPVSEETMTIHKDWFEHCKKSWYNEGYIDGKHNRKSQFEEPASEDYEKALNSVAVTFFQEQQIVPNFYADIIIKAVKHGANWQKERFEKNRLAHCNGINNEQAELEQEFVYQHLDKHERIPTFLDAIEFGMRLQKEQIMKNAVECHFSVSLPSSVYDKLWINGCKEGDKLIIIKEKQI